MTWLYRHMLGLSSRQLAQGHTVVFGAAAVEVMRAVRTCHPDRRISQMHALYARGPGAGMGPLAVAASGAGSAGSGGVGSREPSAGVVTGGGISHPAGRAEPCGYEPARVHPLAAVRIVEHVVRWGRAFNFAPLQHFSRALLGDDIAWTARGRRELSCVLLQCYGDTFDWRAWTASIERGDDGGPDASVAGGSDDEVPPFEQLLRSDASPSPGSIRCGPRGAAAGSAPSPTISVEYLVVGVMAVWQREWQRACARLDAAHAALQRAAAGVHVSTLTASLRGQLQPVLADVDSLRRGAPDAALAALDAEAAAAKAVAVAEERLTDGGAGRAHALLATAYRGLVLDAVGSMVRVHIDAARAMHTAEQLRRAAEAATAKAAAVQKEATDAAALAARQLAERASLADQLRQALATVSDLQRKNTELVLGAADEAGALHAAQEALARERAARVLLETQLAASRSDAVAHRAAEHARALEQEERHHRAVDAAMADGLQRERNRMAAPILRVAASTVALRASWSDLRSDLSAAMETASTTLAATSDAVTATLLRHARAAPPNVTTLSAAGEPGAGRDSAPSTVKAAQRLAAASSGRTRRPGCAVQ
jgi:hypothetical protein